MTVNYNFKTKPYQHQLDAIKEADNKVGFGYLMEMGTGKSKCLLDDAGILYLKDSINFLLIVAPKGVYQNWVNAEIPVHLSDDIERNVVRWTPSPNKKQVEELKGLQTASDGQLDILVMNVEAFSTRKGNMFATHLADQRGRYGMIAVDESTTVKNHKAKRTKNLIKIAHKFFYRRILTGSPVTNNPMDLYSQFHLLSQKILGCNNFYTFQNRYAWLQKVSGQSHTYQQILGYRNLDELSDKIKNFSFRVLKKDCLDLPPKTYTVRHVSLSTEQVKMYMDLKREAMIILEDDLVSAPQVITQMLRLQQVLSGHVRTDDGELIEIPNKRIDALLDTISEIEGKVLIWSRFRYDIQKITQTLNKAYGQGCARAYYGDTSDADRQQIINSFQDKDSPLRFFVGNPQTAGLGLTLTAANTVVYYANDFNLETRIQSEDRCHRIGQNNPVTYVDLIAEGTIDERVVKALQNKLDLSAKVLKEERKQWLELTPKK